MSEKTTWLMEHIGKNVCNEYTFVPFEFCTIYIYNPFKREIIEWTNQNNINYLIEKVFIES